MSTDWIDCPEEAPAPGWYWTRCRGDVKPVRIAARAGLNVDDGPDALWACAWEHFRVGHQICPTPIALPGSEKPAPSIRLLTDDEVQALRWAIARARTSPATPTDGEECNAAGAVVDRLAATADTPPFEPLPRSTEQELREWAEAATRSYRDSDAYDWPRGYRSAAAHVLAVLDAAGDEPEDVEDDLYSLIAETVLETGDAEDGEAAASIAGNLAPVIRRWSREERAPMASAARLTARSMVARGRLDDHATRLDDHVNRFEVLETRLDSYGKRLDRVEQARDEQQAANLWSQAMEIAKLANEDVVRDFPQLSTRMSHLVLDIQRLRPW